ncbi:MAG: hypothetical protein KC621_00625 [Myxococcales bacterium]|nr:hypothetical protein [Myxococcales bacterium]
MTTHRRMWWLALVAGCSPATVQGTDSGTPAATFTEIHAALFPQETGPKCDSCHGQPASQVSNGLLYMGMNDRDAAYAALTTQTSTSTDCGGAEYVVPGDPEGSLFYTKLLSSPPCGERMPLGGGALSADQIEMVRSWIADGAADD